MPMVALTGDAEDTMNGAEVRVWMLLLHQSIGDIFYVAIARICKENRRQRVNCIKIWGNFKGPDAKYLIEISILKPDSESALSDLTN